MSDGFFITAFVELSKDYGYSGGSRCFGFMETFEAADEAVRNNHCDIWEYTYDYAVIEKIGPGIHSFCEERWFYKFNQEKRKYEPIPEPIELKHYCNLSIG